MTTSKNGSTISSTLAAVTFDVTGTLIHAPRLGEIYTEVLTRHGLEVDRERVEAAFVQVWREQQCVTDPGRDRFDCARDGGRGFWRSLVARLCHLLGVEPPIFAAAELYDRFAHATAWEIFPDVEPVLDTLRDAGLRLGVIANWDSRLPALLEDLDLAERFDVIVYSGMVGVEKPHREIFRRALEHLDLPASRVLHVGDQQIADAEGAVAAGIEGRLLVRDHPEALRRLFDRLIEIDGPGVLWRSTQESLP